MSPRTLRVVNAVLAVLFLVFAALQFEDDNPELYVNPSKVDVIKWVVFYGLLSALFIGAFFRKNSWILLGVAVLFCVFLLIQSGPGLFQNLSSGQFDMTKSGMNPQNPPVEQSREFFGALIALAAVGFLAWQRRVAARAT